LGEPVGTAYNPSVTVSLVTAQAELAALAQEESPTSVEWLALLSVPA